MVFSRRSLFAGSLVLLTGCTASLQGGPTLAPTTEQNAAITPNLAQLSGSLPFKTVAFDDGGTGRTFAAGPSETAILRSKADLEAFLARRKPAVPPVYSTTPAYGSPNPVAFLPPPGPDGVPAPEPTFAPSPLPEALIGLDFSKYEAIAFFDGAVKVASLSRITKVQDLGGSWSVATKRWEPPANPSAIPDVNGRLHVIAIARAGKPATFVPTEVADGSSPDGGGYGVGGNPTMRPLWQAVPNPEVTEASLESMLRAQEQGNPNVTIDVSLQPASTFGGPAYFTPDSLVWIATLKGDNVRGRFASGGGYQEVTMLFSPEDGHMLAGVSKGPQTAPAGPPSPGTWMSGNVQPLMFMGDPLAFTLQGPAPTQPVTLTLKAGNTVLFTRTMPYSEVASFQLKLDPAHVPGLADVPAQAMDLTMESVGGSIGQPFHLVKDRTARTQPQMTAARGLYDGLDLNASLDKFATSIAIEDWQGQDLRVTSREATTEDWALDANRLRPMPGVKLRLYEIAGTYPNYFLPDLSSGTGKATVMKPAVVRIVLPESPNMVVVSSRGFLK